MHAFIVGTLLMSIVLIWGVAILAIAGHAREVPVSLEERLRIERELP